jgi:hypothetical protein
MHGLFVDAAVDGHLPRVHLLHKNVVRVNFNAAFVVVEGALSLALALGVLLAEVVGVRLNWLVGNAARRFLLLEDYLAAGLQKGWHLLLQVHWSGLTAALVASCMMLLVVAALGLTEIGLLEQPFFWVINSSGKAILRKLRLHLCLVEQNVRLLLSIAVL